MPELPEVEVAARQLRGWMKGVRIVAARAYQTRVIRGQSRARFAQLGGHKLAGIERAGKWMLLSFDGGEGLVSHLGMTGKWIRRRLADDAPLHTRATFELADGHAVDYRDPRLFGRLIRGTVSQLRKLPSWTALGPDPLPGIDADRLHAVLAKTRRSLKEALMDQRTLAGLGNIYVSESLHRARLDPQRPGTTLTPMDTGRLVEGIAASLREALKHEDTGKPVTYVEEGGENFFLVYDRAGQSCKTCGKAIIQRIVQGGRSTFFCSFCQPTWRRRRENKKRSLRKPRRPPRR